MRTMGLLLAAACAPPPEVVPPGSSGSGDSGPTTDRGPSIQILYPESDQEIALDPGCALTVSIIVYVEGLELVPFGEPVDGQGHWHGGPDLDEGYCMSWVAFCDGRASEPEPDEASFERYDESGRHTGLLTLRAALQTSDHEPIGAEDQVEVSLVPAEGESCP